MKKKITTLLFFTLISSLIYSSNDIYFQANIFFQIEMIRKVPYTVLEKTKILENGRWVYKMLPVTKYREVSYLKNTLVSDIIKAENVNEAIKKLKSKYEDKGYKNVRILKINVHS